MKTLTATQLLNSLERRGNHKRLIELIDEALDNKDKERFLELTARLKGGRAYHSDKWSGVVDSNSANASNTAVRKSGRFHGDGLHERGRIDG